ncbi:transposase [Trinickia dabaoshanensis]|uniref:Transposase n=1 Tax=Trinickia dabaoshanensis TaxID=564714 RepID=A0A2N7VFN6_9BURK|nr:transposase [Trinickia dabaoshanensis]PMS15965.1 transposase [Trinickia dabaoshanensis]
MFFEELTDDEWARLAPLAADEPVHPHRRGRPRAEPRVVTNAVLWILTTGERWSKLPARYPSGPTCRRRFDDWLADGTLGQIVAILSEFGRTFAYVPQPDAMVQAAPKAAPMPAPESPRLRGVFWTNPESWHAASEAVETLDANGVNAPCASTVRRELPVVASSRRAPTPGAVLRAASERSDQAPPVDSLTVTKRSDDYRGYVIHACAQPVAKQLQLSYRASAEIVKEGRRIERSGLIGPRFTDNATAEGYALEWARDWIDRHEAAAQARLESAEQMSAVSTAQPASAEDATLAPALAAAPAQASQPARVLDPSMIRSRTPQWLIHAHPDGRGDTKPPELLFHA